MHSNTASNIQHGTSNEHLNAQGKKNALYPGCLKHIYTPVFPSILTYLEDELSYRSF